MTLLMLLLFTITVYDENCVSPSKGGQPILSGLNLFVEGETCQDAFCIVARVGICRPAVHGAEIDPR